jgi:hypothetical protein
MAITVLGAVYGTNINGIDVTSICQSIVDQSDDDINVSNGNFNDDPNPGGNEVLRHYLHEPGAQ